MEIITLGQNNIEQEHVCCAISNNNDCQVASKKLGSKHDSTTDSYLKKETSEANVSSNTYQQRKHGSPSLLTDICTSTAFGYPASSRDKATPTYY